ncbi:MAG: hypothetical protein ACI836_001097, partial [Saprospiraceae bacterium]
ASAKASNSEEFLIEKMDEIGCFIVNSTAQK